MTILDKLSTYLDYVHGNEWALRGFYSNGSMGEGSVTSRDALISKVNIQGSNYSGVAIIPSLCMPEDDLRVICIDCDYKDTEINKKLEAYLKPLANNQILGHPDKLGKFFFLYDGLRESLDFKIGLVEIFHSQNRCNVYGRYKNTNLSYRSAHDFKHIFNIHVNDLPVVSDEVFETIELIVGSEIKESGEADTSRHGQLKKILTESMTVKPLGVVYERLINSPAYKDLVTKGRDGKLGEGEARKEVNALMRWGVGKMLKDDPEGFVFLNKNEFELEVNLTKAEVKDKIEFFMAEYQQNAPEVDKTSLARVLYKMGLAHSPLKDKHLMAWMITRACCIAVISTKYKCMGITPKTATIILGGSGGGKSLADDMISFLSITSSKFDTLVNGFENKQSMAKTLQMQNRPLFFKDEIQKIFQKDDLVEFICENIQNRSDNHFSGGISLKNEDYGHGYGLTMNCLFTSTPHFLDYFSKENAMSGLLRRFDIFCDPSGVQFKISKRKSLFDTSLDGKTLINLKIDELFTGVSTKQIPMSRMVRKGLDKKGVMEYFTSAVYRESKNLPLTECAEKELEKITNKINELNSYVLSKYGETMFITFNSMREKVVINAMFYNLCCKEKPLEYVDAKAICYGVKEFFNYQWTHTEEISVVQNHDKTEEDIKAVAEVILIKMKESPVGDFTKTFITRRFLGKKKRELVKHLDTILNYMIESGLIEKKPSGRGHVYSVSK